MLRIAILLLLMIFAHAAVAQDDTVFEVDTLNAGLPPSETEMDLLTPQTAVSSFLDATESNNFDAAAQALNLNDLPVQAQAGRGPLLAEQLAAVIDRKVVISWQALLERPDSLDANAPSENAMAGQARRSLLLGVLELDGRSVAIRLNRVKAADEPAIWVFSRQTVNLIEPLFARYGPSEFEKALPSWLRQKGPLGLYWWELLGIPLLIVAAGFASLFVWQSFGSLARRVDSHRITRVVRDIRLPTTLVVLATIVWSATANIFIVSGLVSAILEPFIVILFVSAALIVAITIIDGFLERIVAEDVEDLASPEEEDQRAYATTIFAVRRLTVAIAVLLGVGITLTTANVFQTLGFSLLAGAGGLTLLLGFAAKEVLGNILASLQISANRSARVGDQLLFEDTLCTVERIHFSFVQLKVWDGTRLIVPVSEFVSKSFTNRTLIDSDMVRVVILTVGPQTDIPSLRKVYEDWMDRDDRVGPPDSYECYVIGQNEYGLQVRFSALVPDPRDGWDVECGLREALVKNLQDAQRDSLPHLGTNPDGAAAEADTEDA